MSKQRLAAGWRHMKLGELFSERAENNCSELRLLSVTGSNGVIPRSEIEGKDNSSEDKRKYLKVCKGDIAYNTMRMWQGVSALSAYDGIVSPAYTVLIPRKDICAKYFAYLFKLSHTIFNFYRYSQGLVDDTRNLKYRNFALVSVDVPPLAEQRAIAEILTTADRLITIKERLITAKRKQKRWLVQQLVTGKMRLPGFCGKWKKVTLEEFLFEINRLSNDLTTYPIYSSSRRGLLPQSEYYTQKEAVETSLGYKCVKNGQVTYRHMSDDEIFHFNINSTGGTILVSAEYPVFDVQNADKNFIVEHLNSQPTFRSFCKAQKKGGTRTRLYFKVLKTFKLKLPSLLEQQAIAAVLTAADREIELLTRELEQHRLVKKHLMQQLLTGRMRTKGVKI